MVGLWLLSRKEGFGSGAWVARVEMLFNVTLTLLSGNSKHEKKNKKASFILCSAFTIIKGDEL